MLPDFQSDPSWIQERLKFKISIHEIERSIQFLVEAGYLKKKEDGRIESTKETLDCLRLVQGAALVQSHKQMFGLATESIDNTPEQDRNIEGFTFATSPKRFEEAKKILVAALDRIEALEAEDAEAENSAVYQVEIAFFPLTKWRRT